GPGRIGGGDDAYATDDRKHRLPRERQPLAEMRAYPVGHELARHDDIERARIGLEGAELGRLQPAVEGPCPKIAAKSGADRFPGSLERGCDGSREIDGQIRVCALHWPAPPYVLAPRHARDKRILSRATRVARPRLLFSLAPGADSRPEFCF